MTTGLRRFVTGYIRLSRADRKPHNQPVPFRGHRCALMLGGRNGCALIHMLHGLACERRTCSPRGNGVESDGLAALVTEDTLLPLAVLSCTSAQRRGSLGMPANPALDWMRPTPLGFSDTKSTICLLEAKYCTIRNRRTGFSGGQSTHLSD